MLRVKDIILRTFEDEVELNNYIKLRNNIGERAITDHVELCSKQNLINEFKKNSLWHKDQGTLLITNDDAQILGIISFSRKSEFDVSVGYCLVTNATRGKGIMTKALSCFTDY